MSHSNPPPPPTPPRQAVPEPQAQSNGFRFSIFGLVWLFLGFGALMVAFQGSPAFLIVALAMWWYAYYLFRGGRWRFIIW